MNKEKFVKSPLNYIGGKHKLLSEILPLFPKQIDTFIDLFTGGANVTANVVANRYICNDVNRSVIEILERLNSDRVEVLLSEIDYYINKYKLSKENRQGYLELRNDYNNAAYKQPMMLYALICYSFNNQLRFNSKGEFNMPFGCGKSSFNPTLRDKFVRFCENLQDKDIRFGANDFIKFSNLEPSDGLFVYCDPPYLNSYAPYNERNGWTVEDENELRNMLCDYNSKGIKWALSNNAAVNQTLIEWANSNNFKIHYLSASYNNCNYQKKNRDKKDMEILITNY